MSVWGLHVAKWCDCTRCPLSNVRKKVVLAKGQLPADVMLVGEAPGESEDVLGKPFVGPAGQLLDQIILQALEDGITANYGEGPAPKMVWTNLVACIPKDGNTKRKNVEPLPNEIEACRPRLVELFKIAKPKLIVAVGSLAEKEAKAQNWGCIAPVICPIVSIIHPAAILRGDITRQGLDYQRAVVILSDAFADLHERSLVQK